MAKVSLRALNERESGIVVKIDAEPQLRRHLTEMGFDPGSIITVINKGMAGLMVVQIKGCCRVAVSREMAGQIYVDKLEGEFRPGPCGHRHGRRGMGRRRRWW